jgi:acyl carrier protein phosphodiesterase
MNYLGHLYFSNGDLDLMICNLYGDHVKGTKFQHYPEKIQQGIILHRSIDSVIDNHYAVLELKKLLYPELPKVTGIAIDLYFDHLLAKHWREFHPQDLSCFLARFFNYSSILENEMKDDFRSFLYNLRTLRWIEHYHTAEGLEKLCQGVSKKISFENSLNIAPAIFKKHTSAINKAFHIFMIDARSYFNVSN